MIVRFEPGVETVLREIGAAAASTGGTAWVVGGAVRDAVTGNPIKDLDVSIVGSVRNVVRELAAEWNAAIEQHEAFSTATLTRPDGLTVDFVRARSEVYRTPGALPFVSPSGLLDDLRRRDFTVNAIAADLRDDSFGEVVDPCGGIGDLEAGILRAHHTRSFVDDPTRLFRASRYALRLGLSVEGITDGAARNAVAAGALDTVSADRRRREVELLISERRWADAAAWLNGWGVWAALADGWEAPSGVLKRIDVVAAWAKRSQGDGVPPVADLRFIHLLACASTSLMAALAAKPAERRTVARINRVLESLGGPESPAWWRAMDGEALMVLLPALALSRNDAEKKRLSRYIECIRPVRTTITGDDIVAAGIPPSPRVGAALRETLDALRTGRISGRDSELAFALEQVRRRSR